jgi:hypothetical protein
MKSLSQSTAVVLSRCNALGPSNSTPIIRNGDKLCCLHSRGAARNFSSKHQSKNSTNSRPRLKTTSTDLNSTWYSSTRPRPATLDMGRYGLTRVDYKTLEPPVWTVPPHPPIKTTSDKVVFPLTVFTIGCIIAWAFLNPEDEDMKNYWKRVETGEILYDDDDDDDDDEDDDDVYED